MKLRFAAFARKATLILLTIAAAAQGSALAQDHRAPCPKIQSGSVLGQMPPQTQTIACDDNGLGTPNQQYNAPNNFWDNDAVSHGFKNGVGKLFQQQQ
jgi:hypothetical protein